MTTTSDANAVRAQRGAQRQIAAAHKALRTLERVQGHRAVRRRPELYDAYIEALTLRVENPHLTMAQIADSQRVTKNTYWSRLRRAFEYAAWFERNAA